MSIINVTLRKKRIGWIGTGVMGASMCGHLMRAGFAAKVFNRTKSKAEGLLTPERVCGKTEILN
jgi:3-hydroxyisobutyrate dehydrogenase